VVAHAELVVTESRDVLQPLVQQSQSLHTRVTDRLTATVTTVLQLSVVTLLSEAHFDVGLDRWQGGRPLTQQLEAIVADRVPGHLPSSSYSLLPQPAACVHNLSRKS